MGSVLVVDADAHVIEGEDTWDYLEGDDRKYRPTLVASKDQPDRGFWLIDGQVGGWIIKHAGDDSLMIGTDYGHFDPSTEIDAISLLRDESGLPPATTEKILSVNPRKLYGI